MLNNQFRDSIILLRFPLSFLLMPVFLFAVSQVNHFNFYSIGIVFFILHFIVYPSSNGYNACMDLDTESIGGVERPPPPPRELKGVTHAMDALAVFLSLFLIDWIFGLWVSGYVLASRAYSSNFVRLKKYPIWSFLIVFIFQGAYVFSMVYYGVSAPIPLSEVFSTDLSGAILGVSFILGGAYPLTQIYQHEQDQRRGDKTLSLLLGYRGTFVFSMLMFLIADICLFAFFLKNNFSQFWIFQGGIAPVLGYFLWWMSKVWKGSQFANYRLTMNMNILFAVAMNLVYASLWYLNYKRIEL